MVFNLIWYSFAQCRHDSRSKAYRISYLDMSNANEFFWRHHGPASSSHSYTMPINSLFTLSCAIMVLPFFCQFVMSLHQQRASWMILLTCVRTSLHEPEMIWFSRYFHSPPFLCLAASRPQFGISVMFTWISVQPSNDAAVCSSLISRGGHFCSGKVSIIWFDTRFIQRQTTISLNVQRATHTS